MKVLAIFFLGMTSALAQTGQLKMYLFDTQTNSMLKNWKMKVFLDDSLCKNIDASNENGLVMLSKIKPGMHSVLLRPEGHPAQRGAELEVFADSTSYFTFAIMPKNYPRYGKR